MTFKHVKFEDSPIMRSLEKVAREKGLVKPQPLLQKNASVNKVVDTVPTSNLMENIFKLCAGLRNQGQTKEALEVELNFLNYKKAQTLYETSKEKGEDLVQSAHPDGSHKLEGVDAEEATFEDILDVHTKMMQVMEKKPSGKLSNANLILKEVKRALGQSQDLNKTVVDNMNLINVRIGRIANLTSELTFSIEPYVENIRELTGNPTIDNIKKIQAHLKMLHTRLDPSGTFHYLTFGTGGLSEDTWAGVQELINDANRAATEALNTRIELRRQQGVSEVSPKAESRPTPSAPVAVDPVVTFSKSIDAAMAELNRVKGFVESDDPKDAQSVTQTQAWLDKRVRALQALKAKFAGEEDKASAISDYQALLTKYMAGIADVKKDWMS